jgi:hypothetical protein
LDHDGFDAEFGGEGIGQFALEADEMVGLGGIGIDVGSAAFSVGAPGKNTFALDGLEMIGGKDNGGAACKQEKAN